MENSHVSAKLEEPLIYQELYGMFEDMDLTDMIYFQCRIAKHLTLESDGMTIAENIKNRFEKIEGISGDFTWSEKTEGSSSYAQMIKAIPQRHRLKTE